MLHKTTSEMKQNYFSC